MSTDAFGRIVLTVSNLRIGGSIQPQEYGIYFTGLINGDSARESQIEGEVSSGSFVTTYVGTNQFEVINTNYFGLNAVSVTSEAVKLEGKPAQNGVESNLTVVFNIGYGVPVNGTLTVGLPYQNIYYEDLGPTPSRSMIFAPENVKAVGFYF
jgi:hypothetical protein